MDDKVEGGAKEGGWIILGQGDTCIALPAELGMQVISQMVLVNAGYSGNTTISEAVLPMKVMTSEAMTVMRVKHQMFTKAQVGAQAENLREESIANAKAEMKLKQLEIVQQMKRASMDRALSPYPGKEALDSLINKTGI